MPMETIEIPRFLLDYFDSNTIRTPLESIRGFADVMLRGAVGPLTQDQRRFLEIIKYNAERLDQHFGIVLSNQHYIVWEEQAIPSQIAVRDLMLDFKEVFRHFSNITLTIQEIPESLYVRVDKRHIRNAFVSIRDFVSHIHDQRKGTEILVKIFSGPEAVNFLIEFDKGHKVKKTDLPNYESFLYVTKCVMKLHGGQFSLKHETDEKLGLALVFPDMAPSNSGD